MINVTETELDIILEILRRYVPDCEVRVFGSRYKGTQKRYSDLDLVILGKEKLDWQLVYDIKEAFQESELTYRVDVLDWNSISSEFQKVINQGYEVIKTSG
ncbi:nucleotidyltransferase family protein [Clostridium oryzae]|uniref:Nucleotidyltransferase domain protein n=1 Tax=Clostridium oryzae TaxID=1450648 RepID=A0A1V4IQF0_9CLOT|nr:nucleotidyltransferase domain-containing protein [Clostridium oryzae]OPJ62119.1 nucleotidyltransferase domain protein [Clostridium oryzae]